MRTGFVIGLVMLGVIGFGWHDSDDGLKIRGAYNEAERALCHFSDL